MLFRSFPHALLSSRNLMNFSIILLFYKVRPRGGTRTLPDHSGVPNGVTAPMGEEF